MKKRTIAGIIAILILLMEFIYIGYKYFPKSEPTVIERVDTVFEHEKVDSLKCVISEKDSIIMRMKDSVRVIREIQYVERERIKTLPIDSGISLLKENLLTYGAETKDVDSVPKFVMINKDTVIILGEDNLKDINIAFSDLGFEREVNEKYVKWVRTDSIIRVAQDSIIYYKTVVIDKQNTTISSLEIALKKEKRKKNKNTAILGALSIILAGLNFIH